jgi:hypothetical protein
MTKCNKILLIQLILFFGIPKLSVFCAIENPVYEWLKHENSPMNDMRIFEGNIYTIGASLKKWDTLGILIWEKPISGTKIEISKTGELFIIGNFNTASILIGNVLLANVDNYDFYLAKIDTSGTVIWAKNCGVLGSDKAKDICLDYDNEIYINVEFFGVSSIQKYANSNGIQIWNKTILAIFKMSYSAIDSTLVFSGNFMNTLTIDSLSINAVWNPVWGMNPDVFLAKMKLDKSMVFLVNVSQHHRHDDLISNIRVNQSNGYIYLAYWAMTLGGSYTDMLQIDMNGLIVNNIFYFNSYTFGALLEEESRPDMICSDNDSLVSFFENESNCLYIRNEATLVDKKIYQYTDYFTKFLGTMIWYNNSMYAILYDGIKLAKFGDSSYVPLSIFFVNNDTVCSKVNFNTNYMINSGQPPYTVIWNPVAGLINPNVLNPGFNLDTTTTYVLTVTDGNNNTVYDTVTFTVLLTPDDSIASIGNTLFCYGVHDSVQLSSHYPQFINKWTNNLGVVANDTSIIWAYPNYTYTLTTYDTTSGCFSIDNLNLNVYNLPAVMVDSSLQDVGNLLVKCNMADSTTLMNKYGPIPSSQLTWFRDGILIDSNKQSVRVNVSGQYILKNTDNYCSHADTLNLLYSDNPVTVNVSNNPVCKGDSVIMFGSGSMYYIWSNGIADSIPFIADSSQYYLVTATDANGCTKTSSITLSVISPTVNAHVSNNPVCKGDTVILFGSGSTNYVWSNGVADSIPFTADSSRTYLVIGTDASGCTATSSINLIVITGVVNANVSNNPVCIGDTVIMYGSGSMNYSWSNGITDSIPFIADSTQMFEVTATDANGCTATSGINLTVITAVVNVNISNNPVCSGDTVILFGSGSMYYVWSNGVIDNIPFKANSSEVFYVTATDSYGCTATSSIAMTVHNSYQFFSTKILASGSNYTFIDGTEVENIESDFLHVSRFQTQNGCDSLYDEMILSRSSYAIFYPNPVEDRLIVEYLIDGEGELILYNMTGQAVLHSILSGDQYKKQVNLESFASGLYYYVLYIEGVRTYYGKLSVKIREF